MKENKPKKAHYAVNVASGEIHKLSAATGSCHLPADALRFATLKECEAANYFDRCGHCLRRKARAAQTEGAE